MKLFPHFTCHHLITYTYMYMTVCLYTYNTQYKVVLKGMYIHVKVVLKLIWFLKHLGSLLNQVPGCFVEDSAGHIEGLLETRQRDHTLILSLNLLDVCGKTVFFLKLIPI